MAASSLPKQARYRTALRPAPSNSAGSSRVQPGRQDAKSRTISHSAIDLRHKIDTVESPDPPAAALELYLGDLIGQFDALPMTSRARGPLANRIRQIETELDARSGV